MVLEIFKSLSSVFMFKLCHFKGFDDYIILHNFSMLLTYMYIHSDPLPYITHEATRESDVVIIS